MSTIARDPLTLAAFLQHSSHEPANEPEPESSKLNLAGFLAHSERVAAGITTPDHPVATVIASQLASIPTAGRRWRSVTLTLRSGDRDALRRSLEAFAAEHLDGPLWTVAEQRENGTWHAHGLALTAHDSDSLRWLWSRHGGASASGQLFRLVRTGNGTTNRSRAKLPGELAKVIRYALKSYSPEIGHPLHAFESHTFSSGLREDHQCRECGADLAHKRADAVHCRRCKKRLAARRYRAKQREAKGTTTPSPLAEIARLGVDGFRRGLARLGDLFESTIEKVTSPYLMNAKPSPTTSESGSDHEVTHNDEDRSSFFSIDNHDNDSNHSAPRTHGENREGENRRNALGDVAVALLSPHERPIVSMHSRRSDRLSASPQQGAQTDRSPLPQRCCECGSSLPRSWSGSHCSDECFRRSQRKRGLER